MALDDQTVIDLIKRAASCSIEFSRTSKQDPSWSIKQYHQGGDEATAIARIFTVDTILRAIFVKGQAADEVLSARTLAAAAIVAVGEPEGGAVPYQHSMADTANSATSN